MKYQYLLLISIILLNSQIFSKQEENNSPKFSIETRPIPEDLFIDQNDQYGWSLLDIVHNKKNINDQNKNQYCKKDNPSLPIKNESMCENGSNKNIGYIISIQFTEKEDNLWQFQIGGDFHYGMALFLDGILEVQDSTDLWWKMNWNSEDVIYFSKHLSEGYHEIQIIGAEKCCDGNISIRFTRGESDWRILSEENIELAIQNKSKDMGLTKLTIITKEFNPESKQLEFKEEIKNDKEKIKDIFREYIIHHFQNSKQPDGYCTQENPFLPFKNKVSCRGQIKENIVFFVNFDFLLIEDAEITFKIKADFGKGFLAYIDSQEAVNYMYDIDSQYEIGTFLLGPGLHNLQIIGIEDCCDTGFNLFFKYNNRRFKMLLPMIWKDIVPQPLNQVVVSTRNIKNYQKLQNSQKTLAEHAFDLRVAYDEANVQDQYCSQVDPMFPISNTNLCYNGSNQHIAWKIQIQFYNVQDYKKFSFRVGPDFSCGLGVYVNGVYKFASKDDLWWDNKWSNKHVQYFSVDAKVGQYNIEIYGVEICCGGNIDIQFKINDMEWLPIGRIYEKLEKRHEKHDEQLQKQMYLKEYRNETTIQKIPGHK